MKELISRIWTAPAKTAAGAVVALGIWLASDAVDLPDYVALPAAGVAVFVGAFYPPKKS